MTGNLGIELKINALYLEDIKEQEIETNTIYNCADCNRLGKRKNKTGAGR
jgi:hypothetical protein